MMILLSIFCFSLWKPWISLSACSCSLSIFFSSDSSFWCVLRSSSTAFWISSSASSMSSRLSRSSSTLSYTAMSQPCGHTSSSCSSSSLSSSSSSLSSSSLSSSLSSSASLSLAFFFFLFTFFLYSRSSTGKNGELSPTNSENSLWRFCSSMRHDSISSRFSCSLSWHSLICAMMPRRSALHLLDFCISLASSASSSFSVPSSSYRSSSFVCAFFKSDSSLAFSFSSWHTASSKPSIFSRICISSCDRLKTVRRSYSSRQCRASAAPEFTIAR
mmetsp:Transcript_22443/g.56710  ORF Transcript_22443/g.56710 Transcript_22443/m.56710 type:complete len:273 (-) Transcript_22443:4238-5056(-)